MREGGGEGDPGGRGMLSVQDWQAVFLGDELSVEVEEPVEATGGLGFIDVPRHDQVGRVVVPFGFDES